MASVKSLGLHLPAGLRHAINEQLLPPNPTPNTYRWDILPDDTEDGQHEDELLVTKDAVIWSRGGVVRKSFRFNLEAEPIVQALFAYFPTSEDETPKTTQSKIEPKTGAAVEKALVVFLKTQAHIYFLSGTSHVLHMPFEAEAACTAPIGVIIQRRLKTDNTGSATLKFPRVPPSSVMSSQLTAFNSSQQSTFSIENLGNPKPLKLNLGSTFGHEWEAQTTKEADSRWPRLICLTDPLLDLGLVVTDAEATKAPRKPKKPSFLNPLEEVLHVEKLSLPGAEPLTLAVTLHREAMTYTVWQLSYLSHKDPFLLQKKKSRRKSSLRRSSMQPPLPSGSPTTANQDFRENLGATLPGKRPRKSEKLEKPLDLVSSLEQQDKDAAGVTRRSSRRVSSMLARADLSASHERSTFTEQPGNNHGASRRHDALSASNARMSSSHVNQIHPSLGSLLEAPFDIGLDEGFHNMGLDDHELDGLQHEILFAKIHSVSVHSQRFPNSTADAMGKIKPKVFILKAPPLAHNEPSRSQLLIGIQEPIERCLQLITLHVKLHKKGDKTTKGEQQDSAKPASVSVSPGELRVAQNVVDSNKLIEDEQSVLLILSESMDGRHELSIQAPWRELTKISLSTLFVDNTRSLQYTGRNPDRDVRQRKSEHFDIGNGSIIGVRHPRARGVIDVVDSEGRLHQLKIQLQPQSSQVSRVLAACKSAIPDGVGERLHAGWYHIMQWLEDRQEPFADMEWSAMVMLILAIFLSLERAQTTVFQTTRLPVRKRRPASGSFGSIRESEDWRAMEMGETTNSLGCPPWMLGRGWQWALDEDVDNTLSPHGDMGSAPKFMTKHIMLAKEFIASSTGEAALGQSGYLPTALSKSVDSRRQNATGVFLALHLLLEEEKLDIMTPEYNSPGRADLRVVLCQVGRWLGWHAFWQMHELGIQEELDPRHDAEIQLKPPMPQPIDQPDVFQWIQTRLIQGGRHNFLTPKDMFYSTAQLPESESKFDDRWNSIIPRTLTFKRFFKILKRDATAIEMVEAMHESGMTPQFIDTLPEAVLVPLQDAISLCQPHPPAQWSNELLELVKRSDISFILEPGKRPRPSTSTILAPTHNATYDFKLLCQTVEESNAMGYDEGEGTERQAVIRALFKEDRRLNEVQDLLSTHKARVVHFQAEPGCPESVYLEKQKEFVSRVATGTLAIPAGRGLLYYSLRYPLITQKFHISGFNLNCVVKPKNVTVGVDRSLFTEEKVCWGFFHQGVAAGLAISPDAKGIDSSWILYNKPGQDLSNRHAGFLLALGLNGHLKDVAKWVAFKYLTPKHTMTSIGLLLGLAASYMGTMDSLITRLLSVHATRMLPRGAAELNLSPLTQTSGIMGIGLLYCNSQHRRMSEIMLSEIEHIDQEDEEEPLRSECYRLAAGFALGLINLGKGNDLKGLHDLKLTEKLIMHATATKSVEIVHILDRAAAGAVMAIALIFMKSEDFIVARKIDVPQSPLQFDYVRPDILLLRTIAKNIIMWSKIQPSFGWIQASLPKIYRSRHKLQNTTKLRSTDLPFFSILAGICMSIALRFSGSASTKVRDVLLHYLDQFIRITRIPPTLNPENPEAGPPYDEELARSNARMCLDVLALSSSIVMSGTGDLSVLRRLRSLHGRDDPEMPYGSHLAAHLAIGALFLGCGTATFGTSNKAIASLLIAFYPIFPTDVMDNRSHLQAFRHFWVLATEQRCLVTKDILTGQPVSVPIVINMKQTSSVEIRSPYRSTPCILPPLDQISSVSTDARPQYWDVHVNFEDSETRESFMKNQSIYLRRRPPREGAFASTLHALGTAASAKTANPLSWVFNLDALKHVSSAERAVILENTGAEEEHETGRAIDASLELESGIEDGGDRERVEGAKFLFEWGRARDRMLKKGDNVVDSMATEKFDDHEGLGGEDGEWWVRDSIIEGLKGKTLLAVREAEQ